MARLVASKMAEIHGGHQADYVVTEASIAPYIITCPNMQTRDSIVQQGLYSIAQGRIQFVVHEWRPRFGMGYDPPTHQVWVKLVGLPLQTWTEKGITHFLQRFGHPLQIMPFGQVAGHYRDITALVETKHPRRIPQAYAYREGEYTTQVDVFILAWRQWAPTPFPPPGFPPTDEGHPTHGLPEDDWTTPAHRSPSPASSEVPSEPTVDLSAWSPISHRISQRTQIGNPTWRIKEKLFQIEGTIGRDRNQSLPEEHQIDPSLHKTTLPGKPTLLRHKTTHTPATKNPIPTSQFELIFSLLHSSLLSVPGSIAIKPLISLQTVVYDRLASRAARQNLRVDILDWSYSVLSDDNLRLKGKKRKFIVLSMRGHCAQSISISTGKEYPSLRGISSPTRPTISTPLMLTNTGPSNKMDDENTSNKAHTGNYTTQQHEQDSNEQYLRGPPGFQIETADSTPT